MNLTTGYKWVKTLYHPYKIPLLRYKMDGIFSKKLGKFSFGTKIKQISANLIMNEKHLKKERLDAGTCKFKLLCKGPFKY